MGCASALVTTCAEVVGDPSVVTEDGEDQSREEPTLVGVYQLAREAEIGRIYRIGVGGTS